MATVVLISGAPGAGKSTLAVPLSRALGLPLLSKDVIKEQLVETLPQGDPDPLVWSRVVGAAATPGSTRSRRWPRRCSPSSTARWGWVRWSRWTRRGRSTSPPSPPA